MKNVLNRICLAIEAIYQLLLRNADADRNKPSLNDQKLLDIEQVLRILRIGRTTYYRLVNAGKLVPRKIGERHCYYLEDLEDMIQESKRRGRI
ncbi:helix-turn-helix transcriptional regulator [Sphingobacterium luzhongxinii]|uniref:helix-turn-helix transcriptional regulator n=1 Tax=Sphingobacterium luzhongxinii TaxID=2654181 RepID=UPI0013DD1DBB|nr:helix-turn-helix domain-containing protein [Sphingobacterium sp. xlx-73]